MVKKMKIEEEIKMKVAIDSLLDAISRGGALSDIQRLAARLAVDVGWPFTPENKDEEE
jgi:hypothetical protein|tara:strand:+ start:99 stop:272 length:174 start_codon:yes stop_codon:yes gene_type:complete